MIQYRIKFHGGKTHGLVPACRMVGLNESLLTGWLTDYNVQWTF